MERDPINIRLLSNNHTGKYDFPKIAKYSNEIPKELIPFNYAKSHDDKHVGVHFFIDDYQFERVWRFPDRYIPLLMEYECVFAPDFSLYVDMPLSLKIYNVYRNRVLGHYWQQQGINVAPTLQWANYRTFDFCFDGIEPGGTIAISKAGAKRNSSSVEMWKRGANKMMEVLSPSNIVIYGSPIDISYGNINVKHFDNSILNHLHNL